jgi:hypothetical protein
MPGIDIGTSFIVLAKQLESAVEYKDFRDAFYIIKPATPIAAKMIEKGLEGKVFVKDTDGSFLLLGKDAIDKAVERNEKARRPMRKGVVSVKEKESRKVLAFILKEVAGQAAFENEKLVFCVPAKPIDQDDEDFDVGYHEDVIKNILSECGYDAKAINEAEALCYSELENEGYSGIGISFGSGMINVCVMLNGEPTIKFSMTKCSGDWIDRMAAVATGEIDTVVQAEKEAGQFNIGEPNENPILFAVASYYERLIDYTAKNLAETIRNDKSMPKFKTPMTIIIGGGTSLANGFVEKFTNKLSQQDFPIQIKEVKHASDPLHAVARGCLIASQI